MEFVFVINLDDEKEKFEEVKKQLVSYKIKCYRFSAIHHPHGFVGCALSHLALIEHAKKDHWPYVMVLEDDALLRHKMEEWSLIKKFLKQESDHWDLFIGGTTYLQPVQWKLDHHKILPDGIDIVECRDVHATHFIVYHQDSYDRILGWHDLPMPLEKRPPIDVFIQESSLRTWVPIPFLASQKPRHSTVRGQRVNYESFFQQAEDYLAYFKLMSALSMAE